MFWLILVRKDSEIGVTETTIMLRRKTGLSCGVVEASAKHETCTFNVDCM